MLTVSHAYTPWAGLLAAGQPHVDDLVGRPAILPAEEALAIKRRGRQNHKAEAAPVHELRKRWRARGSPRQYVELDSMREEEAALQWKAS